MPFLNWWPLNKIIRHMLTKVTDAMWGFVVEFINFKYVFLKNESMQKMFTEKALALKGIAIANGIDSAEYRAARLEHQNAFSKKVRSLLVPAAA